jgi:hypothetical protein
MPSVHAVEFHQLNAIIANQTFTKRMTLCCKLGGGIISQNEYIQFSQNLFLSLLKAFPPDKQRKKCELLKATICGG